MGGSSDGKTEIRYAGYIEDHHKDYFLPLTYGYVNSLKDQSPFSLYSPIDYVSAFFGAGYGIGSYPALFPFFGTKLAGVDVEARWENHFNFTTSESIITDLTSAHNEILDDEFEESTLARYDEEHHILNAVHMDTFQIGQAGLERRLLTEKAKFAAELRYKLIAVAVETFRIHMNWDQQTYTQYMQTQHLYLNSKIASDDQNFDMISKNYLWPFTVLDFYRANLGALQGAMTTKEDAGGSKFQKAIGGGMAGMSLAAEAGTSPMLGGLAGLISGFL